MKKIVLDDCYFITTDSNNVMLNYEKDVIKNDKFVVSKDTWYYPSIDGALRKYLDMSLKESKDIQNILNRIEEVKKLINKLKFK